MPRRIKRNSTTKKSPRNSRRIKEEEEESDPESEHDDCCGVCGEIGEVLCCDSCTGVYHLTCLEPPLDAIPDGDWFCPKCPGKIDEYDEDEVEEEEEEEEEEEDEELPRKRVKTTANSRYRLRNSPPSGTAKRTTRQSKESVNNIIVDEKKKNDEKSLKETKGNSKKKSPKSTNKRSSIASNTRRSSRSNIVTEEEELSDSEDTIDSESDEAPEMSKQKSSKATKTPPKSIKQRPQRNSISVKKEEEKIKIEGKEKEKTRNNNNNNNNNNNSSSSSSPPLSPSSIVFAESISQPLVPISNLPILSKPRTSSRILKINQEKEIKKEEKEEKLDEEGAEEDEMDVEDKEEFVEVEDNEADDDGEDEEEKFIEKIIQASVYDDNIHKFENVEKILAWKQNPDHPNDENLQMFLVKWEEKSYRQCTWIPKPILMIKNKPKLKSFERMEYNSCESDDLAEIFNPQYLKIHRIISKKMMKDKPLYLVKWKGLGYEQSTWEPLSEVETDPRALKQYEDMNIPSRFQFQKSNEAPTPCRGTPKNLYGGALHKYQLEGINFMLNNWHQNQNVILADEMGLGKTIQVIGLLASLYENYTRGPILIVVPASVLRNWGREFTKWTPFLNVVRYYGCKKARSIIGKHEFYFNDTSKKNRNLIKFNVLLTSFDMIVQDENILKKFAWEIIVIDEAQRLKNKQSKLLQTLNHFTLNYKILLTGTPLQNNLKELFVLLNFLDNEKFNSESEFVKNCAINNDDKQISNIHQLIKPYILRRLKSEVLQKLPTKNDYIVRVDLSDLQKTYYRSILHRNFEILKKNYNPANIMTELIKCCDHPYLILPDKEDENQSPEKNLELLINSCGKLKLVDKLLDKLKERGHRVLIFSKMTRMLDVFEDYLFYKNFKFERLDGSTSADERQEKIDRFNKPNSDVFCFLLSTRAGGVGINLASADTVIIYDSDWNPHNDLQALNRSHRIGQNKPVMVYRLVTRGTVEERIMQIAKQKLMIEHLVFAKMTSILKKGELDDILRFGIKELFNECDSGPAIIYDDPAIDKLLDRSEESQIEREKYQNEYLNSFKVAPYKTEEINSNEFWDSIFSSPNNKVETLELYGRGKRIRTSNQSIFNNSLTEKDFSDNITSDEDDDDDEEIEDDDDDDELEIDLDEEDVEEEEDFDDYEVEKEEKRKTKKRKYSEMVSSHKPIEDPLIEGKGKEMKVNGFSLVQRSALLKLVMSFGIKEGSFHHLAEKKFGFLRAKSDAELQEYSKLVMKHILEPPSSIPTYQDGIPKDKNFPLKEVLYRIVSIHLISQKVANTKDIKSFSIEDRGWTELNRWWNEPNQIWTKDHDFQLLQGILKHGYGKWGEILQDSEIGLFAASQLVVGRKVPTTAAPVTTSNSPFHQLCRAAKDSDESGSESENSKVSNVSAPFQYKPDNIVSRYMRKRVQTLENALFVEFQFNYPNIHSAFVQIDKNDPYNDADLVNNLTNTRKEDENARKFLESFRELYNRSYQLLENAKRITPLTPVYPQYKDEIDRQKKAFVKLDNVALEARSILSKVKPNSFS